MINLLYIRKYFENDFIEATTFQIKTYLHEIAQNEIDDSIAKHIIVYFKKALGNLISKLSHCFYCFNINRILLYGITRYPTLLRNPKYPFKSP